MKIQINGDDMVRILRSLEAQAEASGRYDEMVTLRAAQKGIQSLTPPFEMNYISTRNFHIAAKIE